MNRREANERVNNMLADGNNDAQGAELQSMSGRAAAP